MKITLSLLSLLATGLFACAGTTTETTEAEDQTIDAPRLWANACSRCHNLRPASSFSDSQIQVIVHHMRVRANLTGAEERAIMKFLKEAN